MRNSGTVYRGTVPGEEGKSIGGETQRKRIEEGEMGIHMQWRGGRRGETANDYSH